MNVVPYLSFDGNCAEAMHFYQKCLGGGGKLAIRTHAESTLDEGTPPEMIGKVQHAHLEIDDLVVLAADVPSRHYTTPSPMVQLHVGVETEELAEQIFAALSEGGTVFMPPQRTFWSSRFGMLRDRYRVSWMVACTHFPE